MKILQLIQTEQRRGAELFTCELSRKMLEQGLEVDIAVVFKGEENLPFPKKLIYLHGTKSNRFLDLPAFKRLGELIIQNNYDLIQCNSSDTLKYAVFSRLLLRWKAPIIFRNASTISKYMKGLFRIAFNRFLFRYVAGVASVSDVSRRDFQQMFPHLKDNTIKIPIGIESGIQPNKITNQFPVVIHVGGFTFEKNHEALLRIFKEFKKEYPEAKLILAGDGPLKDSIESYCQELGLSESVTFEGYVREPLKYISSADLLVLPSIIEGMPGVIVEAMYCKTPVVAYEAGGISELVGTETGYLVPLGEEAEFVAKMLTAYRTKNTMEMNTMLQNAYDMILSDYTLESISRQFCDFYSQMLHED